MSYEFTPMTDEELNKADLMQDGIYNFEVYKCERKPSGAGNPMAKLTLKVWDNYGKIYFVNTFLVFSNSKFTMRMVKHFCDSVGLQNEYLEGKIPEELEFRFGKVHIRTEKGKEIPEDKLNGKPPGSLYPDRNIVFDYVGKNINDTKIKEEDLFDSAIPF